MPALWNTVRYNLSKTPAADFGVLAPVQKKYLPRLWYRDNSRPSHAGIGTLTLVPVLRLTRIDPVFSCCVYQLVS